MIYGQNHRETGTFKKKAVAGSFPNVFPELEIVFRLTYYQRHSYCLHDTYFIFPQDYAYFHMDCMRDECRMAVLFQLRCCRHIKDNRNSQGKVRLQRDNGHPGHASICQKSVSGPKKQEKKKQG
jgi:hypothetical protein